MGSSATATSAPPPPATSRVAGRRVLRPPRSALVDVGCAVAAALLALGAAAWVLRVWRGDLSVPFSNQFDALQHAMFVKGVLDHGWYSVNDSLGAPFGQQLYDFPQNGDNLQLLAERGAEARSEEHTSELQSRSDLVCRLLLEKKKKK